jgi:hypothetical protein
MLRKWVLAATCGVLLAGTPAALAASPTGDELAKAKFGARHSGGGSGGGESDGPKTKNFRVVGHNDLGLSELNGDVFVHGNFAYVGSWRDPCNGRGVKIVDVSDVSNPQLIGTLASRTGTSAEDMVVRRVSTPSFSGDLMGVGIQRCGEDPALDSQEFGLQLWNVTNPHAPVFITEFGVGHGAGGVHELDLFQRGGRVYALLAHPFSEWFDPAGHGDFMIVDVTNPSLPVMTASWGAGMNGFSRGPYWGQGDFGSMFGHSARASADGTKAYASYWDLGVLTFDISDVTDPVLLTKTTYEEWEDGDAHSMTPYRTKHGRELILQNDEDFAPKTPADIRYGKHASGLANEGFASPPIWNERRHRISGDVVEAANQGCSVSDYPAGTAGKIAVVYTPVPFFDPGGGDEPACLHQEQEAAAAAAGAMAVVHDFVAENTSPQWFDFAPIDIFVLFTDHETAQGMVEAGWAKIKAREPSWGYLRIYDAWSGEQVAAFDDLPGVSELPAPEGEWSIHNTEVLGDHAYSSWYSNGIVALDLGPLDKRKPRDPKLVGQFVPYGESLFPVPSVWGVAVRADGVIFASDMGSGLWIVKPKGKAKP